MLYLNNDDILSMDKDWQSLVKVIDETVKILGKKDFAQPVKPYLRYKDLTNRIIAMPAYVGGDISISGLKWIASFPKNIENGIKRAHSVTVLNHADTGQPLAVLNSSIISGIRTAAVTGLVIDYYQKIKDLKKIKAGIIGWGPIGQLHFEMLTSLLGDRLEQIKIFDKRDFDISNINADFKDITVNKSSWEECFDDSDIFMTCTTSPKRYINKQPKAGSLQLNVSLRDYEPEILNHVQYMIVDDWEEVCRENTDIEAMHKKYNLTEDKTQSVVDLVVNNCLNDLKEQDVVMFNPMGMAVFDMSIAEYYYDKAKNENKGVQLPD